MLLIRTPCVRKHRGSTEGREVVVVGDTVVVDKSLRHCVQNGGLPINQKLKSWGTESSMGMPGFPLDMDMPSGHGPLDASLRPDLQAQFPHTSFSQGLLGTPDWSNNALMPGKMPESYLNSCDLDMWVSVLYLSAIPPFSMSQRTEQPFS